MSYRFPLQMYTTTEGFMTDLMTLLSAFFSHAQNELGVSVRDSIICDSPYKEMQVSQERIDIIQKDDGNIIMIAPMFDGEGNHFADLVAASTKKPVIGDEIIPVPSFGFPRMAEA